MLFTNSSNPDVNIEITVNNIVVNNEPQKYVLLNT